MSATFWIEERNEFLKANYGKMKASEIGDLIGATASGVFHQARRLGLRKQIYKNNNNGK